MFGEHLEKRLKQMASDMIEACGKRYRKSIDFSEINQTYLEYGVISKSG
jgi:hypothetical protein